MYNYDFDNEEVLLERVNCLISSNDKDMKCNILVTNKNILFFKNLKENSVLSSREIHELPEYELFLNISLDDINYEVDEDNTIIKIDKNELILFDFDLNKVKNN